MCVPVFEGGNLVFKILIALCLSLSAVLAQAPPAATETDKTPGSISGIVRDVDGAPIADASVRVFSGADRVETKTGADGRYRLSNLPPQDYRVTAYVQMPLTSRKPVTVSPGQDVTGIDFELLLPPRIEGRVLDENGEPVPQVSVFLVGTEYQHGRLRHTFRFRAMSNDQGKYVLDRFVQPGVRYAILAKAGDLKLPAISNIAVDPKMRRAASVPTYYPRSASIDGAERLTLRSGEIREGVDIQLLRSPSYCMEGVLRLGGRPAETEFRVEEQEVLFGLNGNGGFYGVVPTGTTGSDGRMRICGLHPGAYKITASSPSEANGEFFFGTATVAVTDEDVRGVSVPTSPVLPVSGEIAWEGTSPDEPVESAVSISVWSLYRAVWPAEIESRSMKTSIPGEFAFPGLLMDDYQLRVSGLPANTYIKDITYAGASILHDAMRLGSAIGDARLRIIVAHDAAKVQAGVRDEDGNSVAAAHVFLMPAGALSEGLLAATVTTGKVDDGGVYTSGALAPGKYYVVASRSGFPDLRAPENIGKLWRARPKAEEIELAPNQTKQLTLRPIELK
jgi:Carboxypeptidase regulatory-like domain